MAEVVLDASAILARIWREPGFEQVEAAMAEGRVSSVNIAEVVQKLVQRGLDDATIEAIVGGLTCRIEAFEVAAGVRTGLMWREGRKVGLSLGDRACLELASRNGVQALTADRAWAELDLGIEVVLIR